MGPVIHMMGSNEELYRVYRPVPDTIGNVIAAFKKSHSPDKIFTPDQMAENEKWGQDFKITLTKSGKGMRYTDATLARSETITRLDRLLGRDTYTHDQAPNQGRALSCLVLPTYC